MVASSPDCKEVGGGSIVVDYAAGDTICRRCGLVVSEHLISPLPERGAEERCGAATMGGWGGESFGFDDLSTRIGGGAESEALRSTHERAACRRGSYAFERSLAAIDLMLERLNLPIKLSHESKRMFRRCMDSKGELVPAKMMRGKKLLPLISALVYLVCRKEGVPRTIKEICAVTGAEKKHVGRCYLAVARAFDIKQHDVAAASSVSLVTSSVESCVDRFGRCEME